MNTNPSAKRILVYGDSNTWGRVPGDDNSARYPSNKRWTGILQIMLGGEYEVIEEGLNGRTTNYESPHKKGKNGTQYLFACLESHKPIDVVILALGKNDLKSEYELSSEEIVRGLEECIKAVSQEGRTLSGDIPRVIILSPVIIEEKERLRGDERVIDFKGGKHKSIAMQSLYEMLAVRFGVGFVNPNPQISVSNTDGVHLDEDMHKRLAKIVYDALS